MSRRPATFTKADLARAMSVARHAVSYSNPALILPLPQENTDD